MKIFLSRKERSFRYIAIPIIDSFLSDTKIPMEIDMESPLKLSGTWTKDFFSVSRTYDTITLRSTCFKLFTKTRFSFVKL